MTTDATAPAPEIALPFRALRWLTVPPVHGLAHRDGQRPQAGKGTAAMTALNSRATIRVVVRRGKTGKTGTGNFPAKPGKTLKFRSKVFFKKTLYFQWSDFSTGKLGISSTDRVTGKFPRFSPLRNTPRVG